MYIKAERHQYTIATMLLELPMPCRKLVAQSLVKNGHAALMLVSKSVYEGYANDFYDAVDPGCMAEFDKYILKDNESMQELIVQHNVRNINIDAIVGNSKLSILKDICKRHNLPVSGTKPVLIARITDSKHERDTLLKLSNYAFAEVAKCMRMKQYICPVRSVARENFCARRLPKSYSFSQAIALGIHADILNNMFALAQKNNPRLRKKKFRYSNTTWQITQGIGTITFPKLAITLYNEKFKTKLDARLQAKRQVALQQLLTKLGTNMEEIDRSRHYTAKQICNAFISGIGCSINRRKTIVIKFTDVERILEEVLQLVTKQKVRRDEIEDRFRDELPKVRKMVEYIIDGYIYGNNDDLLQVAKAIKRESIKISRKELLVVELTKLDTKIRSDSHLCNLYINYGTGDPKEIAIVMCEMNFYYNKTSYPSILDSLYCNNRKQRWYDSDSDDTYSIDSRDDDYNMNPADRSRKAKDEALLQYAKKHQHIDSSVPASLVSKLQELQFGKL